MMRSFSNILFLSFVCVQSIVCVEHTLVSLANLDPTISLELRYASINNFVHENLYGHADAFLIKEAAQELIHVQKELRKEGLSLKIWDAYRPLSVQWTLWRKVPDTRYVSDPHEGGRHTRGTAVDVTLVDLKTKKELPMGTDFDDFTPRAWIAYAELPQEVLKNRKKLQNIMSKHGFSVIKTEWWHFDYKGWQKYPVLDTLFVQLCDSLKL